MQAYTECLLEESEFPTTKAGPHTAPGTTGSFDRAKAGCFDAELSRASKVLVKAEDSQVKSFVSDL